MDKKRIYLAGGIMNLPIEEAYGWRCSLVDELKERDLRFDCFNPLSYEEMDDEVEFDLNALRHSDLVVVNFNDPKSLGTMAEIAIAYEHRIPIIGYCEGNLGDLHPWSLYMMNELCTSTEDLINTIMNYDY